MRTSSCRGSDRATPRARSRADHRRHRVRQGRDRRRREIEGPLDSARRRALGQGDLPLPLSGRAELVDVIVGQICRRSRTARPERPRGTWRKSASAGRGRRPSSSTSTSLVQVSTLQASARAGHASPAAGAAAPVGRIGSPDVRMDSVVGLTVGYVHARATSSRPQRQGRSSSRTTMVDPLAPSSAIFERPARARVGRAPGRYPRAFDTSPSSFGLRHSAQQIYVLVDSRRDPLRIDGE